MNRKIRTAFLGTGILAGALALVGCRGGTTTTTVATSNEATGISVSGHGEVLVKSDTGFFTVGVQISAKSVAEAQARGARAAEAVINSVKKNGIDEKDIKTTGLSIQPEYTYPRDGGKPSITGYQVTNEVTVKVRKLDTFSKVIDDSAAAGGDDVRLSGIRFDVEDNEKALEQARAAAVADAKKKAAQLAKLGEVSLGAPQSIQEVSSSQPPAVEVRGVAALKATGADTATPVQPGTGAVVVDVVVRWAIK